MGRYYDGDIQGKFWFAIQSSNAADRFGCIGEPRYLNYYFSEDELDTINEELKRIEQGLGDYKKMLDDYFKEHDCYNDEELASYLKITVEKAKEILSEYADWILGIKIKKCVELDGHCQFDAEL